MKNSFIHKLIWSSSKIYFTIYTRYIVRDWLDRSLAHCRHAMGILLNKRWEQTTDYYKNICVRYRQWRKNLFLVFRTLGAGDVHINCTAQVRAFPRHMLSLSDLSLFLHLLPSKVICCCPEHANLSMATRGLLTHVSNFPPSPSA